jgi:hypothetical protein
MQEPSILLATLVFFFAVLLIFLLAIIMHVCKRDIELEDLLLENYRIQRKLQKRKSSPKSLKHQPKSSARGCHASSGRAP